MVELSGLTLETTQEIATYIREHAATLIDEAQVQSVALGRDKVYVRLSLTVEWPPALI